MLVANLAALALVHMPTLAALILQEQPVGWDPISLWRQMGVLAKIVVGILFIMSGWSIGVMIDRAMAFSAARKQSRAFAPAVAGALRDGKIDEAIKVAERNKKSQSEEHTSELQSQFHLVCRLLLEKKKKNTE